MENQDNSKNLVQESTKLSFFKSMSKGNFIFFIVSYAIIGILILTTILLAVIPTYTGVKFESTPDRIVLKTSSTSLTLYANDASTKGDFNTIWNAYNQASSPTVIDTMFNGYAGQGKEAVYEKSSYKSYSNSTLTSDGAYAVYFYWDTDQKMTNAKGEDFTYYLSDGKTEITTPTYYTAAAFSVTDSTSAEKSTIYLRKNNASTSSTSTRFLYTGYINFTGLYDAIVALEDAGKFAA